MNRKDWLLLAIGAGLAPIQIQKAMFKFSEEAEAPAAETYDFVPYNWGPCSFAIYDDLTELREEGLVSSIPTGRGWSMYQLTEGGGARAEELRSEALSRRLQKLDEIRQYVASRGFDQLLRDVYKQYPKYAKRSLFSG